VHNDDVDMHDSLNTIPNPEFKKTMSLPHCAAKRKFSTDNPYTHFGVPDQPESSDMGGNDLVERLSNMFNNTLGTALKHYAVHKPLSS